ncbi:two pore domain potassium channel family protein [Aquincola sp. S2]|uniref:Two pore domain potassium channel family protein n=1 Tax=Pseudaquabacterium terrae TaxID=2732868 RepID=A0ABX2EK10_9BURK|nr:potassium channel family protein [Aquabacterium terrae]NRF68921.1 two pore domain potassium channel family protein [Aquabacterium terrae]
MPTVLIASALLVVITVFLHYEVLRGLNSGLPRLRIPDRFKLLVVVIAAFCAHALEIFLYGLALYALITAFGAGSLAGAHGMLFTSSLYFSAETYTSLGFGDLTPVGPIRLLAGVEALNGLLLIGWSASFTYISMERFWSTPPEPQARPRE